MLSEMTPSALLLALRPETAAYMAPRMLMEGLLKFGSDQLVVVADLLGLTVTSSLSGTAMPSTLKVAWPLLTLTLLTVPIDCTVAVIASLVEF